MLHQKDGTFLSLFSLLELRFPSSESLVTTMKFSTIAAGVLALPFAYGVPTGDVNQYITNDIVTDFAQISTRPYSGVKLLRARGELSAAVLRSQIVAHSCFHKHHHGNRLLDKSCINYFQLELASQVNLSFPFRDWTSNKIELDSV